MMEQFNWRDYAVVEDPDSPVGKAIAGLLDQISRIPEMQRKIVQGQEVNALRRQELETLRETFLTNPETLSPEIK